MPNIGRKTIVRNLWHISISKTEIEITKKV